MHYDELVDYMKSYRLGNISRIEMVWAIGLWQRKDHNYDSEAPQSPTIRAHSRWPSAAVLVNHFDLGLQADFVGEKPKHKVVLLWELAARKSDGSRFTVSKEFTASLGDYAVLRGILESWRGGPLTDKELEGFEITNLHGKQCTLELVRKLKKNGRDVFVDVAGVYRPRKNDAAMIIETPITFIPEWVAQKMSESLPPLVDSEMADQYVGDQPF